MTARLAGAGVKLYFLREDDGVLYYFARIFGHPNMRVAVSVLEATSAREADPALRLEDRGRKLAEIKVETWLKNAMANRQWP